MNNKEIDVNKPVENPVLKGLLEDLARADKNSFPQILEQAAEELAQRAYLLAVMILDPDGVQDNGDGTAVFKKDSRISFAMLSAPDGVSYLPVFTDWTELRKAEQYSGADIKTLILSFDDMAAICNGEAGIVVNPYSHNFVIPPKNVTHMKQHKDIVNKGYSEQVFQKETTVQIGEPADYPTEMTEAIINYAKTNKAINAIWLKLMIKDGEKSYLLIVDFTGDRREIFGAIANVAIPHIHNGMYVDMVPYADSFGQKAASGEPFYRQ